MFLRTSLRISINVIFFQADVNLIVSQMQILPNQKAINVIFFQADVNLIVSQMQILTKRP